MTTTLPPSGDTPAELAEHLASGARLVEAFHLMPGVARAMREAARLLRKPCTCHPDDNPPVPCPQKYALSECRAAAPPAAQGDPYFLGLAHTLLKALKRLSFAAQTACGTAGLDTELVDAIAEAERAIEKSKGYPAAPPATQQQAEPANDPVTLARLFHATYERLAPEYGYETRPDTKDFDPESKNGRLMVRVCAEISNAVFCPTPAVQPLTAQQLDALIERHCGGTEIDDGQYSAMVIFAASVERAHGIGTDRAAPPADDEAVRLLRKARYMCDDSDTFTRMALAKAIDAYLAKVGK